MYEEKEVHREGYYRDPTYVINGLEFYLTCMACPEQYDVYKGDKQVAYIRLRWGNLRVTAPDVGGEEIYQYSFDDGWQGIFSDDEERMLHLQKIADKLSEAVR